MPEKYEIFQNPPSSFKGKPFWAWNGDLSKEELLSQIDAFKAMGMGGYFCHSRTGLITEYLGEEWFGLINACADYGRQNGMETWLYDEDRWPSGTAGGAVTENPAYRMKFIRMEILPAADYAPGGDGVAAFEAELEGTAFHSKKRLFQSDVPRPGNTVLRFSVEPILNEPFFNGNTYTDTMNREATDCFIRLTHARYADRCKSRFGDSIKGIFTDEPHRGGVMCGFSVPNSEPLYLVPFTDSLWREFQRQYGYDLIEFLPELFLHKDGERVSQVKWHYMELTCRLFLNNFLKPVQDWCGMNGLSLTGHVLHEDSLAAQTAMIGSVMRAYEYMDIPGIDVLSEGNRCFWVAKQLQSVSRQMNKPWRMSELYGCTGWQFDFRGHKAVGDWQALFGVNLRCHHLSWYSMQGEAKRDYPGSIFFQSAWHRDYAYIEDYFSRLNVFMHEGTPVCGVLVVNPVESMWSLIYPGWSNSLAAKDGQAVWLERRYADTFHMLCASRVDFDYGDEDHIHRFGEVIVQNGEAFLQLGHARYSSVLVAGMLTIRKTTLAILNEFANKGGNVVIAGEAPCYVDAAADDHFKLDALRVAFNRNAVLAALKARPLVTVTDPNGNAADDIYAQALKVGNDHHILLLNVNRTDRFENLTVRIGLGGYCERWNARDGSRHLLASGDPVEFTHTFEAMGELPIVITGQDRGLEPPAQKKVIRRIPCGSSFDYTLSEPNVAVLDFVNYRIDGGPRAGRTEILKADQAVRKHLGIPLRSGVMHQPWFEKKKRHPVLCELVLEYEFTANRIPDDLRFAAETPERFAISINGTNGFSKTGQRWVDPCFTVFQIHEGVIKPGRNVITLRCDFCDDINLEAIYLLGGFGVTLDKAAALIGELPGKLAFGDFGLQSLPFYGAGVNCRIPLPAEIRTEKSTALFSVRDYQAACLKAENRIIVSAPYELEISEESKKNGFIDVQCQLTRRNTFGPLHLVPPTPGAYSPSSFTSSGQSFASDGYALVPQGITGGAEFLICG